MLLKYSLRHLLARPINAIVAALAIAAVVTVFVVVLSLADGLQSVFNHTGDPLDLMVLHNGSLGDMNRGVDRGVLNVINDLPGIRADADGRPMVSPEQYSIVYLTRRGSNHGANITMRGLPPIGFALRPGLKVVEGRRFRPGAHELMVSQFVSRRYENLSLGDRIHLGHSDWTVVGVFDGGESIINTEIWADMDELSDEFGHTNFYSLILARAVDMNALSIMIDRMTRDPKLELRAVSQNVYARERGRISILPRIVGVVLAFTLSVGALFIMLFVMDDAFVSRVKEIAMLRVVGFGTGRIFLSFLGQSFILALAGGLLGSLISLSLNGMTAGAPFMIYREIGFSSRVTPRLLISGLIVAVVMGLVGGLLTAYRAAHQNPLAAT